MPKGVDLALISTGAVKLFDRNFKLLSASPPRAEVDLLSFLSFRTLYAGTYFAQVTASPDPEAPPGTPATYWLSARPDCAASLKTRCFDSGDADDMIWANNDADWRQFGVDTASPYYIEAQDPRNSTYPITAQIALRDATGKMLADSLNTPPGSCISGDATNPCIRINLKPGRYFVSVRAAAKGESRYQLNVLNFNP